MTNDIPGYKAGTYALDTAHSSIGFEVRHMMMSKVRGRLTISEGTVVLAENPLESTVTATVDAASINTGDDGRNGHLRSEDFFAVETYPTMTFVSTGVRENGGDFLVDGELTMHGVTKPVTFELELGGFGTDLGGTYKVGATATATINREDFGLTWNAALETGGVLVSKDVKLTLDLQANQQA